MSNAISNMFDRWRDNRNHNLEKELQRHWEKADAKSRDARSVLNSAKGQKRSDEEIAALEVACAHYTLKARKAKERQLRFAKHTSDRAAKRAIRREQRRTMFEGNKLRWKNLRAEFAAVRADARRDVEERLAKVHGKGLIRKLRVLKIKTSGYLGIGIGTLAVGLDSLVAGVAQALAASGSWLLSRISSALPRAWSAVWNAAAWMVRGVLGVVLFLIVSLLEGVLAILLLLVSAIVWPFQLINSKVDERAAKKEEKKLGRGTALKTPPETPASVRQRAPAPAGA